MWTWIRERFKFRSQSLCSAELRHFRPSVLRSRICRLSCLATAHRNLGHQDVHLAYKKAHRIAPVGLFCSQTYFFASSLRFLAQRALASRESFFLAAKLIVGLVALTVAAVLVWGAAPFSA